MLSNLTLLPTTEFVVIMINKSLAWSFFRLGYKILSKYDPLIDTVLHQRKNTPSSDFENLHPQGVVFSIFFHGDLSPFGLQNLSLFKSQMHRYNFNNL